jgi:hypothetical protein
MPQIENLNIRLILSRLTDQLTNYIFEIDCDDLASCLRLVINATQIEEVAETEIDQPGLNEISREGHKIE